jgi:hypothetical protein
LRAEFRSPIDRPDSSMAIPLVWRTVRGLTERRRLARLWRAAPHEVWTAWAGRDELW